MDVQHPPDASGSAAAAAPSEAIGYTPVSATDAAELTQDVRDWNFEFMQLSSGKFRASRAAVRIARDFIHSKLAEPLRLSELCCKANLQIRSLEYGFREVTGLTPVAYIRSLRLSTVRRALQQQSGAQRSISEVAMDAGFWHLSQFASDYRRCFGETPTETRRIAKNNIAVTHAPRQLELASAAGN